MRARLAILGLGTLWGCAGAPAAPPGPVVSPTGVVYEVGTPPTVTRFSQTAALYLRSDEAERAVELAREGIVEDPGNPIHYFLAGVGEARLGSWASADSLFDVAQRIYPAYELEVEPERLAAWADAFNRGSEAYADGVDEEAIRYWWGAVRMYDLRSEAHRNLAMLLTQEGQVAEAAEVYGDLVRGLERLPATRVLTEEEREERTRERYDAEERQADLLLLIGRFAEAEPLLRARLARAPESVDARQNLATALVGMERYEEARALYDGLLAEATLAETELYNLGVALFRAQDPEGAAEAFRRLTEARPDSRDAWFNYANALLAYEAWPRLVEVGTRLLELDPLGESSALIVARAHLESGDEQGALAHLQRLDETPIHLEGLIMRGNGPLTTLSGNVVGNAAEPGTVVRLRFSFYGPAGEAHQEAEVVAPEPDQRGPLEVTVEFRATAYRYEWIEDATPGG